MAQRCTVCKKTYPDDKKRCPHCGAKKGAAAPKEDSGIDLAALDDDEAGEVVVLADDDDDVAPATKKSKKGHEEEEVVVLADDAEDEPTAVEAEDADEDVVVLADDAEEPPPAKTKAGADEGVVVLADDADEVEEVVELESASGTALIEGGDDVVVVDEDEEPPVPAKKTKLAPQSRPVTMLATPEDDEAPPAKQPPPKKTMLAQPDEDDEAPAPPPEASKKKTMLAPQAKPATMLAPAEDEIEAPVEAAEPESPKRTKLSHRSKPATMLAPQDEMPDAGRAPSKGSEADEVEESVENDSGPPTGGSMVNLGDKRPGGTSLSGLSALDYDEDSGAGHVEREGPTSDMLAQSLLEEDETSSSAREESSAVDLGSMLDEDESSGPAAAASSPRSSGIDLAGIGGDSGAGLADSGVQIEEGEEGAHVEEEAAVEGETEADDETPPKPEKKRGRGLALVGGGVFGMLIGAGTCVGLWYAGYDLPPEWRGGKPAETKQAVPIVPPKPTAPEETPEQVAKRAMAQANYQDVVKALEKTPVPATADPKTKAESTVALAKARWLAYLQARGDQAPKVTDQPVQQALKELGDAAGSLESMYLKGLIEENTGQEPAAFQTYTQGRDAASDSPAQKQKFQAGIDRINSRVADRPESEAPEELPTPPKPTPKKPAAEKSTDTPPEPKPADEPADDKSGDKKPAKPAPKKPAAKSTDTPPEPKPADEPADDKPAKPNSKKPAPKSTDTAPEQKPEGPAEEKPGEKPAKPNGKKPAAGKATFDAKPAEERVDDKPSEKKTAKPNGKKPAEDSDKETRLQAQDAAPYSLLLALLPAAPAQDQPKTPIGGDQPKPGGDQPKGPGGERPQTPPGEQPKAIPEPEEAGYKFWEALRLAKENNYEGALAALDAARKAHERRRFLRIGKPQNPESDPTGLIFLRCADELKTYWKMRAELVNAKYLGDDAKNYDPYRALAKLGADKKEADTLVLAVKDKLKADKDIAKTDPDLKDPAKDIDLVLAARKRAADQVAALATALEEAKYITEEQKDALAGVKKLIKDKDEAAQTLASAADLLKPAGFVSEKEPSVPKGVEKLLAAKKAGDEQITDVTAKLKGADGILDNVAKKLAAAKYLPADAGHPEVPKGVDQAIDEASSPVVRALARGFGELSEVGRHATDSALAAYDFGSRLSLTEEQVARHKLLLMQARTPQQMLDIWMSLLQENRGRADLTESAALDAERIAKDKGASPDMKAEARAVAGLALRNQGKLVAARDALKQALAAQGIPKDGDWRSAAGQALAELNDPAVYFLPQVEKLRGAGKHDQALAALNAGLTVFPATTKEGGRLLALRSLVNLDLAETLAKGKKLSAADPNMVAAVKDADAAVAAGCQAGGQYAAGRVAETLGELTKAVQSYRNAHDAHAMPDPDGNVYRLALARVLLKDYEARPRIQPKPAEDDEEPIPVKRKPIEEKPVEEKPAPKKPADEPAEEKPAPKKPAAENPDDDKKPAEEKPAPKKPAAEKKPADQPADEKPPEKKPVPKKPADEPADDDKKPAEEKPAPKKPAAEKKPADEPADEKPTEKKPAPKKPADDNPDDDKKPADEKPAPKKPAAEKKPADEPADQKPPEKKPVPKKPADEPPDDDKKPAEEKPAPKKPAAEKKPADEPTDEKPPEKKPAPKKSADEPTEEKLAPKKPADQQSHEDSLSSSPLAVVMAMMLTAVDDETEPPLKKVPPELIEAERLADEAIKAGDPQGHLIKARILAQKGQWAEVLNEYLAGMEKLGGDPERVKVLRSLVENHPAFRMPDGLKSPDPLLAEKHYATGLRLFFAHKYASAEKQFYEAARYNDQDARYLYFLGLSLLSQEKRDEAFEAFKRGGELELQSKPNSAAVSVTLERVQGPQRQLLNRFRP